MPLNKSKGNMYEWITHTWNPLGGQCPHKCTYCSTNKLMRYPGIQAKYSGPPRLIEKELCNLGSGRTIFVCAQNDLFANEVDTEIICKILEHCEYYLGNTYLFQTKNPERMLEFYLPLGSIVCTTIESDIYHDQMIEAPSPASRALSMRELSRKGYRTYVTIEPVMNFNLSRLVYLIKKCRPYQVNIGADSGKNNLPEPSKEKILQLIAELEKFTTVKIKDNLKRIVG